jgi:hypothetical protein
MDICRTAVRCVLTEQALRINLNDKHNTTLQKFLVDTEAEDR